MPLSIGQEPGTTFPVGKAAAAVVNEPLVGVAGIPDAEVGGVNEAIVGAMAIVVFTDSGGKPELGLGTGDPVGDVSGSPPRGSVTTIPGYVVT